MYLVLFENTRYHLFHTFTEKMIYNFPEKLQKIKISTVSHRYTALDTKIKTIKMILCIFVQQIQ